MASYTRLSNEEWSDLVSKAQAGDKAALERLCLTAKGLIGYWCNRFRGRRPGAYLRESGKADMISQGMISALRCVRSFDPSKGTFPAMLHVAVFHEWDREAKRSRHKITTQDSKEWDQPIINDKPVDSEESNVVLTILGKIDKKYADTLKMVYGIGVEPMTMAEIARRTKKSRQLIHDRKNRAVAHFRIQAARIGVYCASDA